MFDVVMIGGGIIGLSTAMALLSRCPGLRLAVLEKEAGLATHQTAHNSGVVHSGIYYRPGSLKAALCVQGAAQLLAFCRAQRLPYATPGKLIVAVRNNDNATLQALHERGRANGVPDLALIGPERLRELAPHVRGVGAIHLPSVAIVDYAAVAQAFSERIIRLGGEIRCSTRVIGIARRDGRWVCETSAGEYRSAWLITCGGLHADRLTVMGGGPRDVQIVPFRGEYYELAPARRFLANRLIYPVPDPSVPFLGVHMTPHLDGRVLVGPNAVLAWKREGYHRRDVSVTDAWSMLRFPGFWGLARRHWRFAVSEGYRSWSRRAFARAAQQLIPELRPGDLIPDGAGVRAQAVNAQGMLLDDFDIVRAPHAIHVRNVPSPAATASLPIGEHIAQMAVSAFELPSGATRVAFA